jgi:hypothetical protein
MFLRSIRRATLVLLASTAITVACDDDDDEHDGDAPPVCQEIVDACHDLDTEPGMARDCHLTAHEGHAEDCEPIHDECIAYCTGAGTGDSGSSSSG